MAEAATVPVASGGRHNRRLRNFLLDRRFQLKYASYLVGITLILSVSLGAILWRTSEAVIAQSRSSVALGEQLVEGGTRVLNESMKVKAVVEMNIVKDPVYADSPALLEAFQSDARKHDESLIQQQAQLEQNSNALKAQSQELKRQQRAFGLALVAVLTLLVIAVGLAGIVVTHRVAGPVYKMKRQLRELGEGRWRVPPPLRKGDELVEFFDTFNEAVQNLRNRQEEEIAKLDAAIQELEASQISDDLLGRLRGLRAHMQTSLDV